MEIQEVERPFREIDISQVGPIIINSLTQINLDTGRIGKPGDLFFSPIKYDYIPNTRLTITMSEPFILDIKKPQYAIQAGSTPLVLYPTTPCMKDRREAK